MNRLFPGCAGDLEVTATLLTAILVVLALDCGVIRRWFAKRGSPANCSDQPGFAEFCREIFPAWTGRRLFWLGTLRGHRDVITDSCWEAEMNGRRLAILTGIAGVLALGEFGSAVIIWLENYSGSFAPGAIAFGVLFLLAAWLLRSRRVTAGAVLAGLLCLFEVVSFAGWTRHNALDWVYQITVALVSLAGLISVIAVLAGRFRRSAAA